MNGVDFMSNISNESITEELMLKLPVLYKVLYHDFRMKYSFILPSTQQRVLMSLLKQGTQNVSDLAHHLGVQRQQLTKLLDALEERELLARNECQENKRLILVNLTAFGQLYMEDLIHEKTTLLSDFFNQLDDDDKEIIIKAFHIFDDFLSKTEEMKGLKE